MQPSTRSVVLLDNSTYFSFRRFLDARQIDADSLYNSATFLECLLTADEIITAPTLAWRPQPEDSLFGPEGPCLQFEVEQFNDSRLREIFNSAVISAIKDVKSPVIRRVLKINSASSAAAAVVMSQWRTEIDSDPRKFLETYSGAVFRTDPASRAIVEKFTTAVPSSEGQARHLAQYMLRTNAAMEFARGGRVDPVPYHPHSYRATYVVKKLASLRDTNLSLAGALLRDAEFTALEKAASLQETSWLPMWGGFSTLGSDAPLVLAVALSAAESPEDLVKRVMDLRDSTKARRFRRWAAELIDSSRSGDLDRQMRAHHELEAARSVLAQELHKLYGERHGRLVEATSAVAGSIDLEALAEVNIRKLGLSTGKEFIEGAPRLRELISKGLIRHKIAFLVKLVRGYRPDLQLNDLLQKAFKTQLSQADLARFAQLRAEQQDVFAQLTRRQQGGSQEKRRPTRGLKRTPDGAA